MTEQQQKAAELLAKGVKVAKVAKALGLCERTIYNWKLDAIFKSEVARIEAEWRGRARQYGAADQDYRLRDLNDRYARLRAVIQQRARDPQFQEVPGGKTGLLTVSYKMMTRLDSSTDPPTRITEPVAEYAVDTGMLAEMRAIEQQTAIELGQWKPKSQVENMAAQTSAIIEKLHQGRKRVADLKAKRDADALAKRNAERNSSA
jgi:hypothetical protein